MAGGRVEGRVALVTGAAQGLGAAIARMLAGEGARVLLTDLQADKAEGVAAAIRAAHGDAAARAVRHDVTSEDGWAGAVAAAEAGFGGLHILVNNAGIVELGTVEETPPEVWRRMHAVDLDSVYLGCRAALPLMRASGGGSIVNISSISGIVAGANLAAYNSAKAAVRHLTKSVALHCAKLAREGQPLVRCNSVHPVFIDTPMIAPLTGGGDAGRGRLEKQIPIGRIGAPEDVAHAVLYLAGEESRLMTGAELVLDGGLSAQ